jgi:hypothetical protein
MAASPDLRHDGMPFTVRRLSLNVNRLPRSYPDSAGSGGEQRAVQTAELGADLLGAGVRLMPAVSAPFQWRFSGRRQRWHRRCDDL